MLAKDIEKLREILLASFQERGINAEKIVIFGSCVKDRKSRKDSDVDLVIVSKDFRNKDIFERIELARGVHRKLVAEIMKPFDIMYYSDEEWKKRKSLIINTAKNEGLSIHER